MDMNIIEKIMEVCDTKTMVALGVTCKEANLLFNFKFKHKAMVVNTLERHLKSRPAVVRCFRNSEEVYELKLPGSEIKLFMRDRSREWQYSDHKRLWSYYQELNWGKTETMYAGASGGGLVTGYLNWSQSRIMLHPFMCDCFPDTRQIWGRSQRDRDIVI